MIITKTSDVLKGTDVLEGTINWAGGGGGGGGASGSSLLLVRLGQRSCSERKQIILILY